MKWRYFALAVLVVLAALIKAGAPPLPLLIGVIAAAIWNYRRSAHA